MNRVDVLIHRCVIVPMNGQDPISDGALAIKDGRISFLGKSASATGLSSEVKIDGKGKVALPGLINCHTHVPMTLFRGVADDQPLRTWLKKTIWPLEAQMTAKDVYDGALLGCLEMIRSGTTCFADTYFQESMVAKAVEESGLRAVLAEGIIESGNETLGEQMFRKSVDFAEHFNGRANGRIGVMLGPHAAYSCGRTLLERIRRKASELGIGIHMHVAESKGMFSRLDKAYGISEVEFLEKLGFLSNTVLAAHCIDLSSEDRQILSKHGVNVAFVPISNMKLGLGTARTDDLTKLGINVCLGTDGAASNNSLDMFETMKFGALIQKQIYSDPMVLPAQEALRMATINGAKALGLQKQIGSIEEGKKADVILVDISKPHLKPLHSICSSLVYSARGSDVDTVIVNGRILMENGTIRIVDEQDVKENADKAARNLRVDHHDSDRFR